MKKLLILLLLFTSTLKAQNAYDITINLKNCKDSLAFLTFYQFDKTMIVDTCTNIKNGKIVFTGKKKLDKGIYSLLSQGKVIYFDFFIDDQTQKLTMESDAVSNYRAALTCSNSKTENDFIQYVRFFESKNIEFASDLSKAKGMSKKDSIAFVSDKRKLINETIATYEKDFMSKNKGSFISAALNLKTEKLLKDIPKAANGRPDSIAVYRYYRKHFWDGVDFNEDGLARTPFFAGRINRYFDDVVPAHPDTLTVEIDRIMNQTVVNSLMYKLLLAHFTSTYESSKIMGFDKIFVHMADAYFKTGKANELYNDDNVVKNIINRANVLRPLLIGEIAPELPMIPIESHDKISRMGFETAKTSEELTRLFYANNQEIENTFLKLHSIKAKYTLLVFWDVDCGHCQKEIPKLIEIYHDFRKANIDLKVLSVYTLHEFDKYQKYVTENKLDWINVYDGVHYNNLKDKYDIYSTPVIYLLDKDKRIKFKRIDANQVKSMINTLEAEKEIGKL